MVFVVVSGHGCSMHLTRKVAHVTFITTLKSLALNQINVWGMSILEAYTLKGYVLTTYD